MATRSCVLARAIAGSQHEKTFDTRIMINFLFHILCSRVDVFKKKKKRKERQLLIYKFKRYVSVSMTGDRHTGQLLWSRIQLLTQLR